MEERTILALDIPEEEETFKNLPLRCILTTTRPFSYSKEPSASRNPVFCLKEPSASGDAFESSSTTTLPRLVLTLLPVSLQVQRGVQKSFAALQRQEPRPDECEHFPNS